MDDENMKKGDGVKNAVPRPALLVAIVIGSLYLVEVVIMNFFHEFAETAHGTMDALILTAVLLPLLYFFIYRPFSQSVKDMKAFSGTLERQVRERTVQLEFSEAVHRAVIASSADAIVRISSNGAILSANPAAHWMFGYGKTELENKHISLLLPGGYERVLVEGFAASLDGWDGHSAAPVAEAVAVTKSGKKLTVECASSECLVNSEISFVIDMRDVSERRKAEKELLSIMDAQPDILYVINMKGALIKWNSALQELCGLTRGQMMERPAADFVCEEDRPVVLKGIKEVFEKGSASIEARFIRHDGALVPHLCNGAVWRNPDGEPLGFIGVGKDITERKKAEAEVVEAEARYRQFSEASFEGIVINIEGKVVNCNSAFARMFGYEPEEIIGKIPVDLSPPESQTIIMDHIRRGSEEVYDTIGLKKDGTLFPIEMQGRAILYHGQKARLTAMRDISERVKAEQAIRESEEKYRRLFNNAIDAVIIFDAETRRFLDANEAFLKIYGYDRADLPNLTAEAISAEPDKIHDSINQTLTTGADVLVPVRWHRKKDGTRFPVELTGGPFDWKGRRIMFGVIRDISERVTAEQAVRESEARFRQLSDLSFEGISISVKGKIVDANAALAQMAGYTLDEIIGKNVFDLTTPESHAVIMEHINKGIESPPYEVTGIRKDGSMFRGEVKGRNILYHGQMARGTAIRDISARKEAEQNVRAAELRYRTFFEQSPFGVALIDMETALPVEFNDLACQQLGYTRGEFARLRIGDYEAKESPEETVMHVAKVLREGGDVFETKHRAKGGDIRDMLVIIKSVTLAGKSMFFCIFQDITERKAAEEKLKAAKDAAEEATQLKDKFVSLVSHDLKTPLSSMIGFLKLVRYDYAEPLNDGAKMILDRAADSGEAMVHLIDDLLTISRFKTGQLKLHRQFFDAEYLGAMMTANYSHLARQKGIEIGNTIPANYRIYGDKTLLTEAIQNLVTNAIKFCKDGDRITISAAEGDAPVIRVRDTGPGIKPNFMNDLFKFEKKTSTTGTAGETGTGFGLPLVKEIMQLHGGDLAVDSEPGKGCQFSLNLPYVRPKILIVDDDRSFRVLQIMQMRELNADIIEAENGVDALNMMAGVRPDLVITDIQMPVMDGLELLKRIKGAPETRDIPVIVQSGEFGMEIRDAIFKFGGDDFITKNKTDKIDLFPRIRRFIG